ncbi:hypothetical protein ABPG77_005207 [Micractinium sp. CCAP 211/92]
MADVEAGTPEIKRGLSMTGKQAQFGDANSEVERIIKFQRNFYYVLKVKKDTAPGEIKANYYKLARLIHPDKCSHPKAKEAAQVLNQAWDTLNNPIKKRAFDAYVDDINVDAPEGMSYAEWEASNMAAQVRVPKWLETLLRIPGVGIIIALILLPISLALVLVVLVVVLVLNLLCLPVRCLCGKPPPPHAEDANAAGGGMSQEEAAAYMAARNAEARKAAGAAPVQQQPPAV